MIFIPITCPNHHKHQLPFTRVSESHHSRPLLHTNIYIMLRRSFLFVVLFKMVAQKITVCPRGGDDNGNQFKSNTKRHGFFAYECQYSTSFETGRDKSLKVRKESTGERSNRSDFRRNSRLAIAIACPQHELFRGKEVSTRP